MVITVHRWFANKSCPGDWLYSRLGDLAKKVTEELGGEEDDKETDKGLQAKDLAALSNEEVILKVGPLFTADQQKTGVLASLSLAQFILESGYGKSELAQEANNCFGMKKSLSGNTWAGSVWDGKSIYTKKTKEQRSWGTETVTAQFRKYACIEDSIADHSAYLTGAKKGSALRYEGLKGCTDYRKVAQIVKAGGYATSTAYVDKLCSIIEQWKLTQYDAAAAPVEEEKPAAVKLPYLIRVSKRIDIKRNASASSTTARKCPVGIYTIVAEQNGYGKLKSGAGWVRLSDVRKI